MNELIQVKRKNLIFRDLNKIDVVIWVKGFKGLFLVGEKYIILAMNLKLVEVFFDLSIFINIIILALEGFFTSDAFSYLNNIITFLLVGELGMKIISYRASNINIIFLYLGKQFQKGFNLFESAIVIVCLAEAIIFQIGG